MINQPAGMDSFATSESARSRASKRRFVILASALSLLAVTQLLAAARAHLRSELNGPINSPESATRPHHRFERYVAGAPFSIEILRKLHKSACYESLSLVRTIVDRMEGTLFPELPHQVNLAITGINNQCRIGTFTIPLDTIRADTFYLRLAEAQKEEARTRHNRLKRP